MISRAVLEHPIERTVESIQALPERPEVIVLCDEERAEERARLLIAGCTAVVKTSLSDGTMRDVLEAFVTRQRQTGIHQLQHQLDFDLPTFDDFSSRNTSMKAFIHVARRVGGLLRLVLDQVEDRPPYRAEDGFPPRLFKESTPPRSCVRSPVA